MRAPSRDPVELLPLLVPLRAASMALTFGELLADFSPLLFLRSWAFGLVWMACLLLGTGFGTGGGAGRWFFRSARSNASISA